MPNRLIFQSRLKRQRGRTGNADANNARCLGKGDGGLLNLLGVEILRGAANVFVQPLKDQVVCARAKRGPLTRPLRDGVAGHEHFELLKAAAAKLLAKADDRAVAQAGDIDELTDGFLRRIGVLHEVGADALLAACHFIQQALEPDEPRRGVAERRGRMHRLGFARGFGGRAKRRTRRSSHSDSATNENLP